MTDIIDYVKAHVERGDCKCGQCIDTAGIPDPQGHTADLVFFVASARDQPTREEFITLTRAHTGVFGPCDPLDGQEHSFIELGGWIGDQGLALEYMALGALLKVFTLLTPKTVLGSFIPDDLVKQMAGRGFVTVKTAPALEAQPAA